MAAKKATKKAKSAKKKSTKKSRLQSIKKTISGEQQFVLSDGKVISSVKQLALELDEMGDHVFYYHVNDNKNDFSNWIRDVLNEMELAEHLMDAKEKHDFQMRLLKHIVKQI